MKRTLTHTSTYTGKKFIFITPHKLKATRYMSPFLLLPNQKRMHTFYIVHINKMYFSIEDLYLH